VSLFFRAQGKRSTHYSGNWFFMAGEALGLRSKNCLQIIYFQTFGKGN